MSKNEIALIPMSSLVLPGGRIQLEIYEPRYQRMITEAVRGVRQFAVGLKRESAPCPFFPIATQVDIIDFDRAAGSGLLVLVEGLHRLVLDDVTQEDDGLWIVYGEELKNWSSTPLETEYQQLADALSQLYEKLPQVADLYPKRRWQDASWLCQRWLEILPLESRDMQMLIQQSDCRETLHYLDELLLQSAV